MTSPSDRRKRRLRFAEHIKLCGCWPSSGKVRKSKKEKEKIKVKKEIEADQK